MSWDEVSDSVCQIGCALGQVGDRWTLLIMRELAMGVRRFEEIQVQTGMSSHLLSTRLKRMEEDELIERKLYSTRPPRHEYFPTRKGKELDVVMLEMRAWALRWKLSKLGRVPSVALVHKQTGETVDGDWQVPSGVPFTFDEVEPTMSDAFREEREARVAAFQQAKKRVKVPRKKSI